MATRQTRIFVPSNEPLSDWAETIIGCVICPLTQQHAMALSWSWFSRYISAINDSGDCDISLIPDGFKQPITQGGSPLHRSIRFRFKVLDADQQAFEMQLRSLVAQHGYAISDVRDYDQIADTGGNRFLGVENQQPGRDIQRATLVTLLYEATSKLVIDGLVGPDAQGRYRMEKNTDSENPNGSTFESLHHLFFNITQVPLSVLFSTGAQPNMLGTYWGGIQQHRQRLWNGQALNEVFISY